MKTIVAIIILVILILGYISVGYYLKKPKDNSNLYQGPVPEGYDEEYFRKTGITKLKENGE